jgi:hypothetical protein
MARPRSPNPTVPVAFRITKSYDALLETLAKERGVKKTALLASYVSKGVEVERTALSRSVSDTALSDHSGEA